MTIEVVDAAREVLEGDDLRVVEQVAYDAMVRGKTKVGDLLGELEAAGPDGRRRIVDQARENLGMMSLADEEGHRAFEVANRALRMRPSYDEHGRRSVVCAEANCNAWPQGEQGEPLPVADRVWWCDRHRHLAGPEDHLPPEPKYEIDPHTFAVTAVGAEKERLLAEDEKLRRGAEEREQRRRKLKRAA